jgi:hypothetical protein
VTPRSCRLLFDGERTAVGVKLDHAVPLRIADVIAEDTRARGQLGAVTKEPRQAVSVQDVVTEDKACRRAGEKLPAEQECLSQSLGADLLHVMKLHAEAIAVTQQLLEGREVARRGDELSG